MSKQPPAACSKCGFQELLTVSMAPHGEPISFTLCNACGWKGWGRGDEPTRLSAVRPLLGKRPPEPEPTESRARQIPDLSRARRARARRESVPAPPSGRPDRKGHVA